MNEMSKILSKKKKKWARSSTQEKDSSLNAFKWDQIYLHKKKKKQLQIIKR